MFEPSRKESTPYQANIHYQMYWKGYTKEQQALEAAVMEVTLLVEGQGAPEVSGNVRSALWTMSDNAYHIKQGLVRLKK
ncbi:hypothetical protein D3C87_2039390 [compost metagenome]